MRKRQIVSESSLPQTTDRVQHAHLYQAGGPRLGTSSGQSITWSYRLSNINSKTSSLHDRIMWIHSVASQLLSPKNKKNTRNR